jgi:hypothetical protein
MTERARLGNLDQIALATMHGALDVHVYGGISVRLHPRRGLDVGSAWFRGIPLAWISPVGEGGVDSPDWRSAWGGGLVTTCGLDNVGAPADGIGLHGTYTFLEAKDVHAERDGGGVVCTAAIEDPRGLHVARTIRTRLGEGRLEIVDVTRNVSAELLEAPLLYHVNVGWPLWDSAARVSTDADDIVPRDEASAPHHWSIAPPEPVAGADRVWEHVGASWAEVRNEELGLVLSVESNLPRLWQWIDPSPGMYVLAIEPSNASVLGRAHDREEGRLPVLEPGEERTTSVTIRVGES